MTRQEHIDNIILGCFEHGLALPEQIAYVLATTEHETGGTFEPVEEGFYCKDPKAFQRKLRYFPWFGRGYVQITWKRNYQLFSKLLGVDLVKEPGLALDPDHARFILCYGFKHGEFTGKKLEDYVRPGKVDFVNARRCINGTDKAAHIAGLAYKWLKKLREQQA